MPENLKRDKFGITNDVNWYKHYPQLTGDVAKVFMSRPNGEDYPAPTVGSVPSIHAFTGAPSRQYSKQGGFVRFRTVPTWGATGTDNVAAQPLNTAASKLYYYVVHGNSRNISYDKSDLMKCYMAYDAVMMVLEEAKRAYKFIKAQSVDNRWVRAIVTGLGWNYDDLTANIVQFRQIINLSAIKLNQISIPNVFDMFACHKELFQNVYVDRASGKPQFMALVSSGAWIYDDVFSELEFFSTGNLPGIVPSNVNWNPDLNLRTVADFKGLINYMIDSIYNSTDIGVIQGDLKRAFNEGQMIDIELLSEDNELPIVPSLEFNLCLHNTEFFPYVATYTVTDPVTSLTRDVFGVVRDTRLMDGNLECGFKKNSADTGNWQPIEGHVMDLIDDWKEDEDAILLMQKFKYNMHYNSAFYEHAQASETGNWPAAVPASVGPALILSGSYYFDLDNWTSVDITNIYDVTSTTMVSLLKLFECGVTFLQYTRFVNSGDGTTFAGPITWEVENVVHYSNSVLYQIQNSMIESLWYNPALYNLG